jgi:hypothetical protein
MTTLIDWFLNGPKAFLDGPIAEFVCDHSGFLCLAYPFSTNPRALRFGRRILRRTMRFTRQAQR